MPYADVNGQRIYFEDSGGDGPPVILGHGFLMDQTMFAHQVEALTPEYRIITWDERGFGQTEFDGKAFTYWDSAADCLGLLDHLGIEEAVVGGMSQGGFLSLRAALTAPQRVRALILIDSQAGVEDPEVQAGYQQLTDTWATVGPIDEVANVVASIIIADPVLNDVWIAKWRARDQTTIVEPGRCLLSRDDITDRLGEISCPAVVIHGTADTAITMERATELARGLKSGRGPIPIEGAAHASNMTHPEPVNAALVEFLRSL